MLIRKTVGISLIVFALAGAGALPASAADEPVSTAPKEVKTAAPVAKVVKPRVVKKFRRYRPVRLAAELPAHAGYRSHVSLVLGVAF
jgi:hypothetical protein